MTKSPAKKAAQKEKKRLEKEKAEQEEKAKIDKGDKVDKVEKIKGKKASGQEEVEEEELVDSGGSEEQPVVFNKNSADTSMGKNENLLVGGNDKILEKLDVLFSTIKEERKKNDSRFENFAEKISELQRGKHYYNEDESSASESGGEDDFVQKFDVMLPEVKFDKQRNQHEYDFLREVSLVIADPDASLVEKMSTIKEAIDTRAAILITAQEDGWSVASELDVFDSPKKNFMKRFEKDIASARKRAASKATVAAKSKSSKRKRSFKVPDSAPTPLAPERREIRPVGNFRKSPLNSNCYVCGSSEHLANKCSKRWNSSSGGGRSGSSTHTSKAE